MSRKILIIEDNKDIAHLVALHLADLGVETQHAYDGESGLNLALSAQFDLIILDLMLPRLDGIEICKKVRAQDIYTPILMLTAKSMELDRVLGLEMGADDYLTKPFSVRELVARVKAIFRRVDVLQVKVHNKDSEVIVNGALKLNSKNRIVSFKDKDLNLTAKEFDLLWCFASNPGRVYSREQLLDQVWGYCHDGYEHTVNSHINRLRTKIEIDSSKPVYILTVWGIGYKFSDKIQDDTHV